MHRRTDYRTTIDGTDVVDKLVAEVFDLDATEGTPRVVLDFERGADGTAVLVAVTVLKTKGITSRDVRVPLKRYVDYVLSVGIGPEAAVKYGKENAIPAEFVKRRRRVLDDEFLRKVAEAYSAAGSSISGLTPDRDERFAGSRSQQFRWVRAARERGFLSERTA
jgi:hypothetical protein